jgi:hypothetical protein
MLVMAGGVVSFFVAAIMVRDSLRDMQKTIGSEEHKTGLFGKIAEHDSKLIVLEKSHIRHREWMIELNAGLPEDQRIRMERS